MLSHKIKRCFSFLLALMMVFSLMPVSAWAEENHDHSHEVVEQATPKTQETIEEETPVAEKSTGNALPPDYELSEAAQDIQAIIDDMLGYYLPEITTAEAVPAAVETMSDDDCYYAYGEIMDLEYEIFAAQVDGLSDADLEALYYGNPMLIAFADAVVPRGEAAAPSWGYFKDVYVLDNNVKVSDTISSISVSGNTVTATARGSLFSSKSSTITITNNSGAQKELKFSYSVTGAASFTDPKGGNSTSGNYTGILDSGKSVTISMTSNSGLSGTTVTLTLSNFSLSDVKSVSKVKFEYDAVYGSITVGGESSASGEVKEISMEGAVLVASPKNGARFLGWINGSDNSILSFQASYTLKPSDDMSIMAVFVGDNSKPHFYVGAAATNKVSTGLLGLSPMFYQTVSAGYLYDNLKEAVDKANGDTTNKVVVLANNGILPAGDYTIPVGVTLQIPFDSANTMYTEYVGWYDGDVEVSGKKIDVYQNKKPYEYRKLTLADGVNLVVDGTINLSNKVRIAQGNRANGCAPMDACSFIKMEEGSNITVNKDGSLYAYGFITGSGTVTANNGANIHEIFQIMDFRGGTQSTDMDNGVFPLSQYYVQNIEVPLTVIAGAKVKAYTCIYMSSADFHSSVGFMGPSGCMFNLKDGYVVKDYNEDEDRIEINVKGSMSVDPLKIDVGTSDINSKDFDLAINSNFTLNIESGNIEINQDIAILPGVIFNIAQGAKVVLGTGNSVYVYDADEWGTFCGASNAKLIPVIYAPGRIGTRTEANLVDAEIKLNGEADLSAGYVYTTTGGANIIGGEGATIKTKAGTQTITHQLVQGTGYTEISITPAKLKNADGSYTETASATEATTYNFCETHGVWYTGECAKCAEENHVCKDNAAAHAKVDSTCIATGTIAYWSCSVCNKNYSDEACTVEVTELTIAKKNHTYSTTYTTENGKHWQQCTTTGCTAKQNEATCSGGTATCTAQAKCSTCGKEYGTALGHSMTFIEADAPTCIANGNVAYYHCATCGNNYKEEAGTTKLDSVVDPATGNHSYTGDWATSTDAGHAKLCVNGCGKPNPEVSQHGFDNACDTVCDECGYERTVAGHDFEGQEWQKDKDGHWHVCKNCGTGETKADHTPGDAEIENVVEATFLEDGHYDTVYYCAECRWEISRETTTVPATGGGLIDPEGPGGGNMGGGNPCEDGHDMTYVSNGADDHTGTCSRCGETETLDHTYDTTTHQCVCGAKESFTITWKNDDGSVLGTTTVAYGEIPTHADPTKAANGCTSYTFTGWNPAPGAVTGEATYTATYSETTTHSFTNTASNRVKSEATCNSVAVYWAKCDKCDAISDSVTVNGTVKNPENHAGDEETVPAVEATCQIEGFTEGVKCLGCGQFKSGHESLGKNLDNHKNITTTTNEATCTENGSKVTTCADCGETVSSETIVSQGHKEGTAATCEAPAICSVCGQIYGSANGHSFNGAIKDLENGKHGWKCTNSGCNEYGNAVVHSYNQTIAEAKYLKTEANCQSEAVYYKSCVCGAVNKDTDAETFTEGSMDADNHVSEDPVWDTDAEGHRQYWSCCNLDVVTKTAHTFENGICSVEGCGYACTHTDDMLEYTSNGDGTHKAVYNCCGKVEKDAEACADTTNKDHNCDYCGTELSTCADNTNNHNCDVCGTKLSDCADNDNNHKCDICGTGLSACEDKLSETDEKPATCEEDGYEAYWTCSVCGKLYSDANAENEIEKPVVIPASGHEKLYENLENGKHQVTCENCDLTKTEDHNFDQETHACVCEEIETFTVTWLIDGAEYKKEIYAFGAALEQIDAPTLVGYTFSGWSELPETMPAENVTITATWKLNQYTITFNVNGGTAIEAITQDYGTAVTAPAAPTKTGFTFKGWENLPATMPAEDITVKAIWEINQYTVTWNDWNGTQLYSQSVEYGAAIPTVTDPTRTADGCKQYTFNGWTGAGDATTVTGDLTLTAAYTEQIVHAELTHVEAVDATCMSAGNIEHWKCECCGMLFKDAEGENTLTAEEVVVVDKNAHAYKEEYTHTDDEQGNCTFTATRTCKNGCELNETAVGTAVGDPAEIEGKEANCVDYGRGNYTVRFDADWAEEYVYKNLSTPKDSTNHKAVTEHVAVAPTCTQNGQTAWSNCAESKGGCGHKFSESETIPALGHGKYVEYAGGKVYVKNENIAALKASTFVHTLGIELTLQRVSYCVEKVPADFESIFTEFYSSEEFNNYVQEIVGKNSEGLSDVEKANATVMYVARKLSGTDYDELMGFLAGNDKYDTIRQGEDSGERITKAALVYGMYCSYVYDMGLEINGLDNIVSCIEDSDRDGFAQYLSIQGEVDLKGFLAAMETINSAVENNKKTGDSALMDGLTDELDNILGSTESNPVETLLEKGFNDEELVKLIQGEIDTYTHTCATCNETVTECADYLVGVMGVDATCTETGSKEHWKCLLCDTLFEDSMGENSISAGDVIIPAGHKDEVDPKHICDVCEETVSECEDKNTDSVCDICGKSMGVAKIGDKTFATLKEALDAAKEITEPVTITLLADIEGEVTISQAVTIIKGEFEFAYKIDGCYKAEVSEDAKTVTFVVSHTPGEAVEENRVASVETVGEVRSGSYDTVVYCSACDEELKRKTTAISGIFAGVTMSLDESLAMNFVVNTNKLSGNDNYAVVTRYYANGSTDIVTINQSEWVYRSSTTYRIVYNKLAAKEMCDLLHVEVYSSDGKIMAVREDSIRGYAMRRIQKLDPAVREQLLELTMFVDMLNYGAAAQGQFNHNLSDLANKDIVAYQQFATPTITDATDIRVKGEGYAGGTLNLESEIKLNFVYKKSVVTKDMYALITFVNHRGTTITMRVIGEEFENYDSKNWRIVAKGMVIADGAQAVTCEIYDGESLISRTVDSIESSCARKDESEILYKTILKLSRSAHAYFHRNDTQ